MINQADTDDQPYRTIYPGTPEWEARETEGRRRREQVRQQYREALKADCPHGPRKRVIGQSGSGYWAGMGCPKDDPRCGIRFLSAAEIFQEWKQG